MDRKQPIGDLTMTTSFRAICRNCNWVGTEVSEIVDIPETEEECQKCGEPTFMEVLKRQLLHKVKNTKEI
jgi:hypothetical protein